MCNNYKCKIMNREQLEQEHAHVKDVLAEENDFINSEDFYKLPETKKRLHNVKKSSLETYLKALSIELWGDEDCNIDMSSLLWAGLLGAVFTPPAFSKPLPDSPTAEEKA